MKQPSSREELEQKVASILWDDKYWSPWKSKGNRNNGTWNEVIERLVDLIEEERGI